MGGPYMKSARDLTNSRPPCKNGAGTKVGVQNNIDDFLKGNVREFNAVIK